MVRLVVTAALVGVVAACGTVSSGGAAPPATGGPPAFDLAAVKANFSNECLDFIVLDDDLCAEILIDGMTGSGTNLEVPTTLEPGKTDRAAVICRQIAMARFDLTGQPLGYEVVGVSDRNGRNLARCRMR